MGALLPSIVVTTGYDRALAWLVMAHDQPPTTTHLQAGELGIALREAALGRARPLLQRGGQPRSVEPPTPHPWARLVMTGHDRSRPVTKS